MTHAFKTLPFIAIVAALALDVVPSTASATESPSSGTSVTASEVPAPPAVDEADQLGSRDNGERCMTDCQCASRECKGFKCVPRDFEQHPMLPPGKACTFPGDCASCDCAAGTCR